MSTAGRPRKLTDAQVREVLAEVAFYRAVCRHSNPRAIAKRLAVAPSLVYDIVRFGPDFRLAKKLENAMRPEASP